MYYLNYTDINNLEEGKLYVITKIKRIYLFNYQCYSLDILLEGNIKIALPQPIGRDFAIYNNYIYMHSYVKHRLLVFTYKGKKAF